MRSGTADCPLSSRDGFVVVAALWILLALATLATIYSAYVAESVVAISADDEAVETELLITASLELAAYQLSSPTRDRRLTRGAFAFRLSQADVAADFQSEAARIDLNSAPPALIAGLFTVLGAEPQAAQYYAERVVGWRSAPKENGTSSEDALYRAAGLTYGPRGGPFRHVAELWAVLSLPGALVERAFGFVTIYSGLQEVNVLDAAPEVIAALPGMSPARLNAFLRQRDSLPPDPQLIARALGDNQPGATTKGSDAYRILTRMRYGNGRQKHAEVVIMTMPGSATDPYRILSWRDGDSENGGGG
jgi:general secretion pathway protein K